MTSLFQRETLWRVLANFWTVALMAFVVVNFVTLDAYGFLAGPFAVLYTGILTLYVGTKEFDRWYAEHEGRHPGEWFVICWTVLIVALFGVSFFAREHFRLSSDVVVVYIAVLSLYAITQKSKQLYRRRGNK